MDMQALTPWLVFGAIAAMSGIITALLGLVVKWAMNRAKPWLLLIDEEGAPGRLEKAKFDNGHIILGKGEKQRRYPIHHQARIPTNRGPVYPVTQQKGINLRAPRLGDIQAGLQAHAPELVAAFEMVDPGLLARTWIGRVGQETIDNQVKKPDWKEGAILPFAIIAGILAIGLIIAVIAFASKGA